MTVVRWNPFREMEAMHNEMERLFSRFGGFGFGEFGNRELGNGRGATYGSGDPNAQNSRGRESQWMLPVDVIETQEALRLKAALPGVDPQDVNIEINDHVLTLTAQRRHEDKGEEGSFAWIEQQYGTFSRSLTLPTYADTEGIEARYNNGLLELTIPKKESARPRRIELQMGGNEPRTLEAGMTQTEPKQLQESTT